eukprot:g56582.t1
MLSLLSYFFVAPLDAQQLRSWGYREPLREDRICTIMTAPANGGNECVGSLGSGTYCVPSCEAGYLPYGQYACSDGILTSQAYCIAAPCEITPPQYGSFGTCSRYLESGSMCEPVCSAGTILRGHFHCLHGQLVSRGTCEYTPTTQAPKPSQYVKEPSQKAVDKVKFTYYMDAACTQPGQGLSGFGLRLMGNGATVEADVGACALHSSHTYDEQFEYMRVASCQGKVAFTEIHSAKPGGYQCGEPYTRVDVDAAMYPGDAAQCITYETPDGMRSFTIVCEPQSQEEVTTAPSNRPRPRVEYTYATWGAPPTPTPAPLKVCMLPPIQHGELGRCPQQLASGASCIPNCQLGYAIRGRFTCTDGRLMEQASCEVLRTYGRWGG